MTQPITLRESARAFRQLVRLHVRAQKIEVERQGLASTHCAIIAEIAASESLSLTGLAERLHLDKGWVSRAVQQLVTDGLVTRQESGDDRRVKYLALTAAGRRYRARLDGVLDAQIERVLARLKAPERARVGASLALLWDAYRAEAASGDAVERHEPSRVQ